MLRSPATAGTSANSADCVIATPQPSSAVRREHEPERRRERERDPDERLEDRDPASSRVVSKRSTSEPDVAAGAAIGAQRAMKTAATPMPLPCISLPSAPSAISAMKSPAAERPIAPATSQRSMPPCACPENRHQAADEAGRGERGRRVGIPSGAAPIGELVAEKLEHLARTLLAARAETQERHRPARTARAPRASADATSRAAPDAAVEEHLDPVSDRVDDRRQRLERRHRAVELPATVIRDDDARCAVLGREHGVLRVEHALDDDRHRERGGEPLEVRPVERRIEEREARTGGPAASRVRTEGRESSGNVQSIAALAVARADDGRSTVRKTAEKPASTAWAISSSVMP